VFKRFRIAILLYILLFVAVGQFLASRRATDWGDSLWVDVWLINGADSATTEAWLDSIGPDEYAGVERFFANQARAQGLTLTEPFRIRVAGEIEQQLPPVPGNGGMLSSIVWSLRMRWFVTRMHWSSDGPTPDITVFAIYHDAATGVSLDRSTALRKGMIAVANLFADPTARGSNQMIVAHEILHTLGATDKYDLATGLPHYPEGFADPFSVPVYPQSKAELMAGRIPLASDKAAVPRSLSQVVIGNVTAQEIGWPSEL
jgi:hypothetical protein